MDHAADGVRVNCLAPGWVATALSLHMISLEPDPAAAALYLTSDEAQWVTDVCLPVDGGYTAS